MSNNKQLLKIERLKRKLRRLRARLKQHDDRAVREQQRADKIRAELNTIVTKALVNARKTYGTTLPLLQEQLLTSDNEQYQDPTGSVTSR